MAGLFSTPPSYETFRPRAEIVATYPYEDQDGNLVARKVRLEPKVFRWQTSDPHQSERWRWSLDGAVVSLYRLPELVDARRVLVVEGEKAADMLRLQGLVATCTPVGANSWCPAVERGTVGLGVR